jgi:hypothetical protein
MYADRVKMRGPSGWDGFRFTEKTRRLDGGIADIRKGITMKKFVKRVSVALASVTIAGVAVIGAGGAASAATSESIGHATSAQAGLQTLGGAAHHRGYLADRDDGHGGSRNGYSDDDHRGHDDRNLYADQGHRDDRRARHHQGQVRWDGRDLYRWDDGRWIDVTVYRHGALDRWYVDQVLAFER